MERRKEYADGDMLACPKCDSDDLSLDSAPDEVECLACGLKFTIRQVAVWEEEKVTDGRH